MMMTIGQIAKQADTGVETIRFYEKRGLIPEPPRTPSGYRQYPADTVRRLGFIARAKELGFTLREIAELLELRLTPGACSPDVQAQAEARLADVERRIRDLQRMRGSLRDLLGACRKGNGDGSCPILEALEPGPTT
jgi:MerR family mercuric resistance operon transcriptional regulator